MQSCEVMPLAAISPSTRSALLTGSGREHDFSLFKTSKVKLPTLVQCLVALVTKGIAKLHAIVVPQKRSPGGLILTDRTKIDP
jgi:hypothetical protein